MTVATLAKRWSTKEVAGMLGVTPDTVARWCRRWAQRPGSGTRFLLDDVDVMVCRALLALNGQPGGVRPGSGSSVDQRHLDRAEQAIREAPNRWLVMTDRHARTAADDMADADLLAWWRSTGRPVLSIYDLDPPSRLPRPQENP